MTSRFSRTVAAVAVIWLFAAAALTFQLWPNLPRSNLQWILFLAFGPPLYVGGEAFFGWLLSERHGRAISIRKFSVGRLAVALSVLLVLCLVTWWLSRFLTVSAA